MKKNNFKFDIFKNKFLELGFQSNPSLNQLFDILCAKPEQWHSSIEHKSAVKFDRSNVDEKILALLTLESRDVDRRFYFSKLSRLTKEAIARVAHSNLRYERFFPALSGYFEFKSAEDLTGYPFNFIEYLHWRDMKAKNEALSFDEFLYSLFTGVSKEFKLLPDIYSDYVINYLTDFSSGMKNTAGVSVDFLSNFSKLIFNFNPTYSAVYDSSSSEEILCFELDLMLHNLTDSVNSFFVGNNISKLRKQPFFESLINFLSEVCHKPVDSFPVRKFKNKKKFVIVGDFNGTSGLAENAMIIAKALSETNPLLLLDTKTGLYSSNSDFLISDADHVIFAVNPPDLLDVYSVFGRAPFLVKSTSIFCLWEFETIPPDYFPGLELVDIIFTPTVFIKNALGRSGFDNVHVLSKPISLGDIGFEREEDSPISFYCTFDIDSSIERKNPKVLVDAFREEFKNDDDVRLIIKSTPFQPNHWGDPYKVQSYIDKESLRDPKLILIKNKISYADYKKLLLNSDVVVSTHRCEGFGYTMAEAVGYGKPLICPAFSGEVDYLDAGNHYSVAYDLISVPFNCLYRYSPMARWADVNKEDLKKHLRSAYIKAAKDKSRYVINVESSMKFREAYNKESFVSELNSALDGL